MRNKGNTDCFGYITSTKCKALNDVICKKEKCPFYKTEEQFKKDAREAQERRQNRVGGFLNNE